MGTAQQMRLLTWSCQLMCRLAFRRDPSKVCCPLACLSLCFVQAHGYWSCAGCPSVVSACLSLWYVQACVYHSCAECLLVLSVPAHDADAVLCAPMFDLYKLVSADAVLYALCFSVCKSMSPLLCCGGHDKLQLPLVCGITGLQHAAMLPFATSAITHAGVVDQKLQWQCLFGTHLANITPAYAAEFSDLRMHRSPSGKPSPCIQKSACTPMHPTDHVCPDVGASLRGTHRRKQKQGSEPVRFAKSPKSPQQPGTFMPTFCCCCCAAAGADTDASAVVLLMLLLCLP